MRTRRTNGTGRSGGPVLIAERWFCAVDLPALRALVQSQAIHAGATEEQVEALVVVANELATNAVTHGAGEGRMRLWRGREHVVCEVVDSGPGIAAPAEAGIERPDRLAPSGRGLWLVRHLANGVKIDAGSSGTTVAARLALRPRRGTPTGGAHTA
jgi:anti-sigma regulatory factor (Ser/Thr protein kinase)